MTSIDPHHQRRDFDGPAAASARAHDGDAVRFLLSHEAATRRESRRVLFGIALFLVLGVIGLNVAIYRGAERRLERDGWARLEASADLRREQIARALRAVRVQVQALALEPSVAEQALGIVRGTLSPAEAGPLRQNLLSRKALFRMDNAQVADAHGRVLYELSPSTLNERKALASLCARALEDGLQQVDGPAGDVVTVAVPIAELGRDPEGCLVVRVADPDLVTPLLGLWPGLGASSGAYLVRREGTRMRVLTSYPGYAHVQGGVLPLASEGSMAASMAATGIESRVQVDATNGAEAWAVTRALPELGWGLVSQAERSDVMVGLRSTTDGLLVLDLGLVLFLVGMAWVWRRLYASGLARREVEITERHARRVQAVLDTAFDAILTFDRQGRVRTANRAAADLFGREPEAMVERPIREMLDWGGLAPGRMVPDAAPVAGAEAIHADGHRIPVEFSLGSSGADDEYVHTAIVRDTRERVEAEKRIRAFAEGLEVSNRRLEEVNAQLEEASRLKSEFLANTSHELRTPLNGMIGFLQLVLDGMCDSPEEERDFLRQALQCSRHLLGLINDVLDIARIEAGKLAIEIERVDVQRLFDEAYTLTHVQAAQRGIQLQFEAQLEDGVGARGDFGKIKQVLINLLGNAIKFTPRGGVTVRAHSHRDLGHIMFEVVDTGIGIPADRQKLIFEKFVQADGSTTRRFGGTGLGLAISRSLIELMGGIIGVHSEGENKGTRMYFSLPIWREAGDVERAPLGPTEQIQGLGGGALILVVEDDPVFRRFLTAVLQQHGFRTAEADHAESGWMLVRRLQPSCVVLDYALSCGDGAHLRTGWDLAERMTTEPETRRIPIVFVTGFEGELREKLLATAFARRPEHMVKPIEGADLVQRIEALVQTTNRPVRILMADDDPTVSAYVRKVLPADRYWIEVANDGEECLHALRTQPNGFDLLLLDLMMPGVSGYDVLREMTLAGIRPDLPVLVLTNFPEARNDEEKRLLEQGLVLDVVSKTAVHDNPQLLPHVLDWHLQVVHNARAEDRREAA